MDNNKHKLSNVEFGLLLLLVVGLPLSEALKNIAFVFYALLWGLKYYQDSSSKLLWSKWDVLIGFYLASATLSSLFAWELGINWMAWADVMAGGFLAWSLAHSTLSYKQIHFLLAAIIISTLIATLQGLWLWQVTHTKEFFELNSVGYFNQSAMYLGMVAGLALWCCLLLVDTLQRYMFISLVLTTLLFTSVMVWGESRGGLIAFFLTVLFLVFFFLYNKQVSRHRIVGFLVIVVLIFGLFLAINPHLIEKTVIRSQEPTGISSGRGVIAEVSLEAFKRHPVLGIGVGNHEKIDYQLMAKWVNQATTVWQQRYPKRFHPHNLYLGTLAERGLVGIVALGLLLSAWLQLVFKLGKVQNLDITQRLVWGFSTSVLLITLFAGFFNTPLRYEHAKLALVGLGLLLAVFPLKRDRNEDLTGSTGPFTHSSHGTLCNPSIT